MTRAFSILAAFLGLIALTVVGIPGNSSQAMAEPAEQPQQASAQPAAPDTDEEPLAEGPADQAPEADDARVQAEQTAAADESRPAGQAEEVDEAQSQILSEAEHETADVRIEHAFLAPAPQTLSQPSASDDADQAGPRHQQGAGHGAQPRAPIFDASTARLSFQAVLTDNMGNALPGPTVDLRFQIYTSPGGVPVGGPITICAVPIVNGVVDTQVPVPASSIDGTGRQMGVSVDTSGACAAFSPELSPRTELTAVPHAYRVDRVASAELDDQIELGDAVTDGELTLWSAGLAQEMVRLNGNSGALRTYGSDGLENITIHGSNWSQILLRDNVGNNTTISLNANFDSGGSVLLGDENGSTRLNASGGGANDGGQLSLSTGAGTRLELLGDAPGIDTPGTATGSGGINLYDEFGVRTIALAGRDSLGSGGELQMFNDAGGLVFDVDTGTTAPFLAIRDGSAVVQNNNALTFSGSTTSGTIVTGYNAAAVATISLDSDSGGGAYLQLNQNDSSAGVILDGDNGTNAGGRIAVADTVSGTRVELLGESTGTGGEASVFDDNGTETVEILGAESTTEGGQIMIRNDLGTDTIELDGDLTDAGFVALKNSTGANKVTLFGESGGAGLISVAQNDGSTGVVIDGDNGTNRGGLVNVADTVSQTRVQLVGESTGTGGEISLFDDDGTETIEILAAEAASEGGSMKFFLADGTGPTIEIDGHFVSGTNPDGRIITDELQITGGSDLSEQFDVRASNDEKVEPGMVVSIDPARPGNLIVSTKAYDCTVAGIISGAGGVETGMYMGQRGTEFVDGQFPVALTGRVYVLCDATDAPIEPGDLLTTSPNAGHAMSVADHEKAQGAIIGKAMTPLKSGRGLVLVLVSLQ